MKLFKSKKDFLAFEEVLEEAIEKFPMRICGYCVMPNHWHLVLWPEKAEHMAQFMHWLTLTHASRWQHYRNAVGHGHIYQGRYKSFAVGSDQHFYNVMRYVEGNALRSGLVEHADEWKWSSLRRRSTSVGLSLLHECRGPLPDNWIQLVDEQVDQTELLRIRACSEQERAYATEEWIEEHGLE